jgi:hypothetical protein
MVYRVTDLLPVALILVVATIGIAVGGGEVLSSFQSNYVDNSLACGTNSTGGSSGTLLYSNCSYAYNITDSGLEGQDELGSWLDTIALIIAAAIIIGVLITSFMVGMQR